MIVQVPVPWYASPFRFPLLPLTHWASHTCSEDTGDTEKGKTCSLPGGHGLPTQHFLWFPGYVWNQGTGTGDPVHHQIPHSFSLTGILLPPWPYYLGKYIFQICREALCGLCFWPRPQVTITIAFRFLEK